MQADSHILARLDVGVTERQSFGASYARPDGLERKLEQYRRGILTLPPHTGWEGDPTDWTANPFDDRNWQFQHHTLRWLNPLRWAALEGDREAGREWVRVARAWCVANIPATKARSKFAWKDMADGNRAIQLALGAFLAQDDAEWLIDALSAHRDWLMDASNIVGGNHGLHQHVGLLVAGACLRDEQAKKTAHERMLEQFTTTFDEQGCNDEGSTAYHRLNLHWWRQSWKRAELEGLRAPSSAQARLDAAALVLAHFAQPDGQLPQIGDSSRGGVSVGVSEEIDYVATAGKSGTAPTDKTLILERGYVISRSGWGTERPLRDESHMVLRHGDYLRAHSHHDLGSLHIYASGRRWLVDPGFHSYQYNDPTRQHLHSRNAHNVASIEGLRHVDTARVSLTRAEIGDSYQDFVLEDSGYHTATLTRRVIRMDEPDCWIVWDAAHGVDSARVRQHWQLDTGVRAGLRDRGFKLYDGARSMHLTALGPTPRLQRHYAEPGDLTGWIGTKWKTLEAGTSVTITSATARPRVVTLIAPSTPMPLAVTDSYVTSTGVLTLALTRGDRQWNVVVRDDSVSVTKK